MNNYQIIINGYHEPRKKLTTKETYALIDEYQKTKDEKIKEKLVNDNIKLVISMTKRFYNRSDGCEDLFQVGMIGLIKAIENFNTSYDLKFSTYAVPLIIGEMKRYSRDNHQIKISRSLKDIAYKILKIKDEYLNKYQREPTIKELAKKLDVDQSVIIEALLSTNSVASLQEEVKNSDGNSLKMIDSLSDEKAGYFYNFIYLDENTVQRQVFKTFSIKPGKLYLQIVSPLSGQSRQKVLHHNLS